MRILHYLTILMLCFIPWHCRNESGPVEKKTGERKPKAILSDLDKKTILIINNKNFSNQNLKGFIKNQYSDLTASEENTKLLSRIFDVFVEQEMILFQIEGAKVNLDEIEKKDFLDTFQINNSPQQKTFTNNIKIQKFLYFTIYKDIQVTEPEIKNYYNNHIDEFRKKEEVLLYQILVKDRDKSTRISGILKNFPQRFEEIAQKESESAEAKNNGLMGHFERGTLPKEMEDVVFSLRINEISPIVESPYGYHIFKVTQKRMQRVLFLESVKEEIKKNILSEKLRLAYQDYLLALKENLKIEKLSENLFFTYHPSEGGIDENN